MPKRILSIVVLALLGATTFTLAELKPRTRAAEYQRRAEDLKARKDYKAAVDMMDMVVALQKKHEFKLPPEFHYKYAQIALLAGRLGTAIYSATKYMKLAEENGKYFKEASRLVAKAQAQSLPDDPDRVSLVRPLIGWGITRLTDDFVDFKKEGERILTENDSKWRSQLMTGALINIYEFKNKNTIDIAANVEFTVGREKVDGFFIGGGFGLAHKIEFVFGYSLGRGKELSHGFQRAMGQFIEKHKGDPSFPEFKGLDLVDGVIADIRDYDGLPLSFVNETGETQPIFPGEPIVTSFNSKWSFGILVPFDIWKVIKDAAKKAK